MERITRNIARMLITMATGPTFIAFILGCLYGAYIALPFLSVDGWWWVHGSPGADAQGLMVYGTVFGLILFASGLFFVLFIVALRKLMRCQLPSFVLVYGAGAIWVALELIREYILYGFTWGHIGYLFYWNLPLIQAASWGGVYVIGFAVVAAVTGLVLSAREYLSIRSVDLADAEIEHRAPSQNFPVSPLRIYVPALLGLLPLAALHITGAYALHTSTPIGTERTVSVLHSTLNTIEGATVQGFETHESLVREALLHAPDLLLLPENIFPFLTIDPATGEPLASASPRTHALFARIMQLSQSAPDTLLVFGAHARTHAETQNKAGYYNTLVGYRDGALIHSYTKRNLMPFGEVVPQFLTEGHMLLMSTGEQTQSWRDPVFGTVASLICSEAAYPRLAGNTAEGASPHLILIPSNDSIFPHPRIGRLHHAMIPFRAIEERAYVVRSVKGGVSSIIDPYGRVLTHSDKLSDSGILTASIFLSP